MSTQRFQGTIVRWLDDKGFGFIRPEHQVDEVFFHIREYRGQQRPTVGEHVVFILERDKQGRLNAKHVQEYQFVQQKVSEQNQRHRQRQTVRDETDSVLNFILILAILFYLALVGLFFLSKQAIYQWILIVYTVSSLIAFALYAYDKLQAKRDGWRIPENTLHLWAVFGGWIGASIAHKVLNHKSRKPEFRMVFYVTILLNWGLLFAIFHYLIN